MVVNENTELRKLRPAELYNLALILNSSNSWKQLLGSVRKEDSEEVFKFPSECVSIIEQASCQERKPAAAIFLEEWATMGKKRPTLGLLLKLLMKLELFRAADYLAEEILKVPAPPRPNFGPAVAIDAEEVLVQALRKQNLQSETNYEDSNVQQGTTTEMHLSQINYPMHMLEMTSTSNNNFSSIDNDIGVIEMRIDQSKSNQGLDNARCLDNHELLHDARYNGANVSSDFFKASNNNVQVSINSVKAEANNLTNTDLIKFSKSNDFEEIHGDEEYVKNYQSDLMKFDSERIDDHRSNEINVELSDSYLPDLNILCPSFLKNEEISENDRSNESKDCDFDENRKTSSPKSSEKAERIVDSKYFHRELMSTELPLCINEHNDSNALNLSVENFSSTSDSQSSDSNSSNTSENTMAINYVISQSNIPCTVVEAQGRLQIVENNENLCAFRETNNAMNSDELPVMVLDFQKQ